MAMSATEADISRIDFSTINKIVPSVLIKRDVTTATIQNSLNLHDQKDHLTM